MNFKQLLFFTLLFVVSQSSYSMEQKNKVLIEPDPKLKLKVLIHKHKLIDKLGNKIGVLNEYRNKKHFYFDGPYFYLSKIEDYLKHEDITIIFDNGKNCNLATFLSDEEIRKQYFSNY